MEHSRSKSWITLPWVSAKICTSMWRGDSTKRSRKTVPSPNADVASRSADATASSSSASERATRMPRPPPPNAALTSTGQPTSSAAAARSTSSSTVTPGRTGTPASAISALAAGLDPMASMAAAGGPTKISPAARAGPGEGRVLGQEAVAGVDGVGARRQGGGDDQIDVQVGVARRAPRQPDGLVRLADERRPLVGVGEDGHGGDAHVPCRAMMRLAISPRLATRSLRMAAIYIRNTPKPRRPSTVLE